MALAVDNPIVNSPFVEPSRWWDYSEGQPVLRDGRRPAGYYLRPRTRSATGSLFEEEFILLDLVNEIRARVKGWRERSYPGTTRVTQELLAYWSRPDRERKLFFCQREAAETIIWLVEAPTTERMGLDVPLDLPGEEDRAKGYAGLGRYGCKMATGAGKTLVMGMLISWSVLNKVHYPQDRRFSDAILVVTPNLTVKERDEVLKPSHPKNIYEALDLVPRSLLEAMGKGRYFVTNWHLFLPEDEPEPGEQKAGYRSVVRRGKESDKAFASRVLKDLGSKEHVLVFNDEAHHAYRPAPAPDEELKGLSAEERKERKQEEEEATVWVSGLDRIQAARGLNFCVDLSATPFYLKGSGHEEGRPFPWLVSDFGLVDAVESGIVKIPRVPVDDNSGLPDPRYFRLWEHIMKRLPASDRQTAKRLAKPAAVLREAEGALGVIASEWKRTFERFRDEAHPVPPAMIVVCDNTKLSRLIYEHVAGNGQQGKVMPELENKPGQEVTLRIDTAIMGEAESRLEGEAKQDFAERLRETVRTVGKTEWEGEGEPPGKNIRCIVSVGMLTEGWDAQNVTQILGLRAFQSQLLCEQVVGRGLRRTNYDEVGDPEAVEYVDVYGIPFEVIPVQRVSKDRPPKPLKPSTLVQALKERERLKIEFPRVEGFIFDVRHRVKADIEKIPPLWVHPSQEPTEIVAKDAVGYRVGRPDRLGPGREVVQDRNPFHETHRLQATVYEIAAAITNRLHQDSRRFLFPQVLEIVWQYLEQRVHFIEAPREEIYLEKYKQIIIERISDAIEPDAEAGEPPLLPIIERFRPIGSTSEVLFRTVRPCHGTTKSHVSHVAEHSKWEHTVAYYLERSPQMISYVKNDHLDFVIPYEFMGTRHNYLPDYLIRQKRNDGSELNLILEVKGFQTEPDRAKEVAAQRWVKAVNHHGGFGTWGLAVCKDPHRVGVLLEERTRIPKGAAV
jgi:type III restriction enzyme